MSQSETNLLHNSSESTAINSSSEHSFLCQLLRGARFTRYLPYVRGLGALRAFYERVLPGGPLQLRVDDFDHDLRLDVDVREIIGINVWHRPDFFEKHERKLFCQAITPGCVVLDVGANLGIYTLLAAKRGARVFAIEADPSNVQMLRHHVHLNNLEKTVVIHEMAASDTEGVLRIFRCPGNSGHSNLFEGTNSALVPSRTIDSLGLPPVDVCKMDIEGAEMMALLGMQRTVAASPNMKLLIEYNSALGHTNGMLSFLCERFHDVYAIRRPPFPAKGPLFPNQRLPNFCNLWASKGFSGPRGPSARKYL